MGKNDVNIKHLINYLAINGPRTLEEILEELGCGWDSWHGLHNDSRKILLAMGFDIKIKNKKYFIIDESGNVVIRKDGIDVIHGSSKRTIKEVIILNLMSQYASAHSDPSITLSELAKEYGNLLDIDNTGNNYQSEIKQIVEKDGKYTKSLISRGYISKNGQDKYELTPKSPVFLKKGYNALEEINDIVQEGGEGYAFPGVMKDIGNLMAHVYDADMYDAGSLYERIGLRGNRNKDIEEFISKLKNVNYKYRVIKVDYDSEKDILFKVGLVVYVADKDRLYFIGERTDDKKKVILRTDKISSISEIDTENEIYGTEEYLNIYSEMFSISIDDPFKLIVEFDDVFNIRSKIDRLLSVRPNGKIRRLSEDGNKLLYEEERVRGVEDVCKWIRSFGRSARVIEPKIVRSRLKESIDQALLEYGEAKTDE